MSRTIDFRYVPEVVQTCIGFVDDEHKTIVREDGSLNCGYGGEDRIPGECNRPTCDTSGFDHRLKPTFGHRDTLVERTQEYGDLGGAIVTTVEEYEETTFRWTASAYRGDSRTSRRSRRCSRGERRRAVRSRFALLSSA